MASPWIGDSNVCRCLASRLILDRPTRTSAKSRRLFAMGLFTADSSSNGHALMPTRDFTRPAGRFSLNGILFSFKEDYRHLSNTFPDKRNSLSQISSICGSVSATESETRPSQ
jgi:hypothetical protein